MGKSQNLAERRLSVFCKLCELNKMRDVIKCIGWYSGSTKIVQR